MDTMTLQELLIEKLQHLTPDEQRRVLKFVSELVALPRPRKRNGTAETQGARRDAASWPDDCIVSAPHAVGSGNDLIDADLNQSRLTGTQEVPAWWNVYEGLSEAEVDRLDHAIRLRAHLTRVTE
jgi:hypothetical protein